MRFKELIYKNQTIQNNKKILQILESQGFQWLVDSINNEAKIEIKNNTIIWHDGYFSGIWHYGIFKGGVFHGTFENGIWENGDMKGTFKSGIKLLEL